MAAGRPRAARRVPAGVSRWKVGRTRTRPPTMSTAAVAGASAARPPTTNAAPTARMSASGIRRRAAARSGSSSPGARLGGGTAMRLRRVIAPARRTSGSRPTKTIRQPRVWVIAPASAGPMTPGRTQAVDSVANICGRRRSGRDRPMATYAVGGMAPAPRPWRNRPATSTSIDGARPPMTRPSANRTRPNTNGLARPARSMSPPTTTIPTRSPRKNAENAQPYSSGRGARGRRPASPCRSRAPRTRGA